MKRKLVVAAGFVAFGLCASAQAAVSAEEAAKLKSELTPLGGERAGNKEGTIPAWAGGYTTPIPGDKPGGRRGDPFNDEKPLFSITAKNMDQYAAKLDEGTKAMLQKYPSYRVDVYRTHRTAAAPKWVYDNTFKNATRATLDGYVPVGAYGGVPFPIAKTGLEVMWNHSLRWRGVSMQTDLRNYQITQDGKLVMTADGVLTEQFPYYFEEGTPEQFAKTNERWLARLLSSGPPIRAGEAIVGRTQLDGHKDQTWVYLTGQRRVRKLPNACCDSPTPSAAGLMSFDELYVYNPSHWDQFDWKLMGKQEMYIPYNSNRFMQPKTDAEVVTKNHLNPDWVRWELHRVWVVEATLRPGERHQAPRSRYYCDEDTWNCVLGDRWDADGKLWKALWAIPFVAPDLPATTSIAFGYYDLLSGIGFAGDLVNEKGTHYGIVPRFADRAFTPDALAGEGVR